MLHLHNTHADILIPDGVEQQAALSRTTHLGISAHQDDLEILAFTWHSAMLWNVE
jgi:hypothetical protein